MPFQRKARDFQYISEGQELVQDFGLPYHLTGARLFNPETPYWLQTEPLAVDFANYGSYVSFNTNPINLVDPSGLSVSIGPNGGTLLTGADAEAWWGNHQRERRYDKIEPGKNEDGIFEINITGKLINFSDNDIDMERALADIKSLVESSFSGIDADGVQIKTNFNFTIAKTMNDVKEDDHLIVFAESTLSGADGRANRSGGLVAAVAGKYFKGWYDISIGEDGERTAAHELGHLFGLQHRSSSFNLMKVAEAWMAGNSLNADQLKHLRLAVKGKTMVKINQGSNTNVAGQPNLGEGYNYFRLRDYQNRFK